MSVELWLIVGFGVIVLSFWFWRRRRAVVPNPTLASTTTGQPMPPGWGSDRFTDFLDLTRRQQFATFVNFRQHYDKMIDVDEAFLRVHENLVDPEDLTAPFFTLLAHAAYRAAAGLAMSTQAAPAFAAMRQCLENALYCVYINRRPASLETWIKRDVDEAAKQKMRSEFTIANLKKTLMEVDPDTCKLWSRMYEKTIDFGAHPNPAALVSALKMHETDKSMRFEVSYLTKETKVIRGTMKSVAQTGVCSLLVIRNVFPKRFDELGMTKSLQNLQEGL
jgi:hypothetical protein